MNSIFHRTSLKRASRTRTRKDSISSETDIRNPPRSSSLARRKTRPPPLQIIPELSENDIDIDISIVHTPATARPAQSFSQQPQSKMSRITLSAYTFSIDNALLILGDEAPRSPALSASSSTTDGASSENVPTTPGTSDDEGGCNFVLPTPRLCPQRMSIRPLRIIKTQSMICPEDEDIHNFIEAEERNASFFSMTNECPEHPTEAKAATEGLGEVEQDFYTHVFEGFISLSPVVPSPTLAARRDSFTLVAEALPIVTQPKPRGRSRQSKPLPLLPPTTPPFSTIPSIPTFHVMHTTAQESIVRRKRNFPSHSSHPPPHVSEPRPLPRTPIPLDMEAFISYEGSLDIPKRGPITIEQVYDIEECVGIYSHPFAYAPCTSTRPLQPAIPETPLCGMYDEVRLPRSSIDSDAPRSSVDSTLSFASSTSSDTPIPSSFFLDSPSAEGPELQSSQHLRSCWSSSTLASLAVEQSRAAALLSPLKNAIGSRARRVLLPPQKAAPQTLPTKPKKHSRRQRSSTSSGGTSGSECGGHEGSPSGLKRKPIPVAMFLRGI